MDYLSIDDTALIQLILRRDANALSEIYDRYARLVFSIAFNVVGNYHSAEDITQDVFIRVWEKANTYNPAQSKFSTWLARITRNRGIDVLRKMGSSQSNDVNLWAVEEEVALTGPATTETLVDISIDQGQVRAAIQQLPLEHQQVLALAYFKGMTHQEIAAALGDPLGTVKTRIRSGMIRLRKLLEEFE